MRRRNSIRYGYAVGTLGTGYLAVRLLSGSEHVPSFPWPEFFSLVLLFYILDYSAMRVRAGVVVGLSFSAVTAALLIGGEVSAFLVGLGALPLVLNGGRSAFAVFMNFGVHVLATAAALALMAVNGRWSIGSGSSLNALGVLVFAAGYTAVSSLIVWVYSLLVSTGSRAKDHAYNFAFYVIHVAIATSAGVFIATAHRVFGFLTFFLLCATVSVMAGLINLSTRVAMNRDGLFRLYKAASSINEALTLNEVFVRARDFALTLADIDFAWLALEPGEDGAPPSMEHVWAAEGVVVSLAAAQISSLMSGQLETGTGFQVFASPRGHDPGHLGTIMAMPLRLGKGSLGELWLGCLASDTHVTRETEQLFAILSSHLTLAVDNAIKFERATMLAYTDPLTGMFNYRYFQHLLEDAISRAEKSGVPVSLIYLDLDYFREINNRYGHQVGDEALKAIARVVRDSCRDDDLVSRPGGDEFTVILPGVGNEQARTVAGRIRDNLRAARLDVGLKDPLVGAVGASVGVATYPEDGKTPSDLVRKADLDMYAGKSEGGQRTLPTG